MQVNDSFWYHSQKALGGLMCFIGTACVIGAFWNIMQLLIGVPSIMLGLALWTKADAEDEQ